MQVVEQHARRAMFNVDDDNITLATMFTTLERLSGALRLDDYSCSQSSLEQIFLSYVRPDARVSFACIWTKGERKRVQMLCKLCVCVCVRNETM